MVQKLPQPLVDLYNVYIHGGMSRRDFMEGIEKFAVGGLTVAAISDLLMPNYALGQVVPKNDTSEDRNVTVASPKGNMNIKGQFARPASAAATAKLPGILVVQRIGASTRTSKISVGGWHLKALTRSLRMD